jgi:hypothetical protein
MTTITYPQNNTNTNVYTSDETDEISLANMFDDSSDLLENDTNNTTWNPPDNKQQQQQQSKPNPINFLPAPELFQHADVNEHSKKRGRDINMTCDKPKRKYQKKVVPQNVKIFNDINELVQNIQTFQNTFSHDVSTKYQVQAWSATLRQLCDDIDKNSTS